MTPMLMSASAPGRPFVLLATDELVPATYNFNDSPLHILAYRSKTEKLVTYANWTPTGDIDPATPPEIEFYDYATAGGRAETNNTPDDPRVPALLDQLLSDLLPNDGFGANLAVRSPQRQGPWTVSGSPSAGSRASAERR